MVKDVRRVAKTNAMREVKPIEDSELSSLLNENAFRSAALNLDFRRKGFPIRTGLAAASLFILGSILIYISMLIGLDEENRGLSFLILGLMAFIPGSYASYQLYGAWKGWKGYHYDQIPSYDD
ncbi:hypothetical protein KXD40_006373 [Peronospora effusa]|uniref:Transmembrane protein 230 n=1 Tax=Peronospora effusa TaxID=542832 RepID=A0A3M6VJK7_9STRA|nr:hypothetical protein DD238_001661 [Peronospora effusa]RQM16963.1 hypothetical protein DD237_001510 [Peronospora effusa]UIZ25652.1 hypothetical protein KXD40_006373 [Peronospora effusa]CAI5706375.1 unnamed protein product [Peronospora effusa]